MGYRVIEVFTAVAHFGFVLYVVFGGFLTWKWRRTIALHVVAVLWGAGSVLIGYDCPLTALENWARRSAGVSQLPPSGFIDHYITGVLYPSGAVVLVQCLAAVTVLGSWIGFVVLRAHSSGTHHRSEAVGAK